MIFITGDTHGGTAQGDISLMWALDKLTEGDYLIVCGDFGFVWYHPKTEGYYKRDCVWLNALNEAKFTTLFVDGNHENFDMLNSLRIEMWNGGKVHRVRPRVIHLMRGQVFNIEGNTFFTFGGGRSVDSKTRIEGVSWWRQEMPTNMEYEEGLTNLEKWGYNVDYILTHEAPNSIIPNVMCNAYVGTSLNKYFDEVQRGCQFKRWFFGHYHKDRVINEHFTAVYHGIVNLENKSMHNFR